MAAIIALQSMANKKTHMKRFKHKRITKSKANRQRQAFMEAVKRKESVVIGNALKDYLKRNLEITDLEMLSFAVQYKDNRSIVSSMHYGYELVGHLKKEVTQKGVIVSFKKHVENDTEIQKEVSTDAEAI